MYAGEEIECIITFKNIATVPSQQQRTNGALPHAGARDDAGTRRGSMAPSTAHSRRASIAQGKAPLSRAPSISSARGVPPTRGHRPNLSINVVSAGSRTGLQSAPLQANTPSTAFRPMKGHGRSLSIMSFGSDAPSDGRAPPAPVAAGKKPSKAHGRSASLQVMPRQPTQQTSPALAGLTSTRQPSPLYESSTPPPLSESAGHLPPSRPLRRKPGTVSANNTPRLGRQPSMRQSPDAAGFNSDFSFPATAATPRSPVIKTPSPQSPRPSRSPSKMHSAKPRALSPRPSEGWSGALGNLNPISRVMSESSATGETPRTSSEFHSMSNHSDETLASEQLFHRQQQNGRLLPKPAHSRQPSQTRPPRQAQPETLMMGYVQTIGNFTLDGSLVNAAPFEEVKRKGVQTGGGVVGIERSKRASTSGMFSGFSWSSIGESLGGLLNNDEMSSMAQMKASASSKAVPLLSTPQSLLFVDLRLAPGESRSYRYQFALPRGLPPSHRGRAMKVNYHLAIGVQRPEGQAVKQVEVPFRVLGSYNARGEILGHDLMSPYVLLQDAAQTTSIVHLQTDSAHDAAGPRFPPKPAQHKNVKTPKQGLEDFLRYTERLLEQPKEDNNGPLPLLSPTSPAFPRSRSPARKESLAEQSPSGSVKEAIDFAVLRSNYVDQSSAGKQKQSDAMTSANRFNIARSGQPVAVLTLLRPAYRLGEAVTGTIDFTAPPLDSEKPSQVHTYAVRAELESAERVDASLALRRSSSVHRVTRKLHASMHENTIFARQVSFALSIPATATPSFETTGVSLVWNLKVEFTTQRRTQVQGLGIDAGTEEGGEEVLEELGRDERGVTLIAKERLYTDTFEVALPLRVYGVPGIDALGSEDDALDV